MLAGTSHVEIRIYCEIKYFFSDAEHGPKLAPLKSADIFIPSINTAIEIDGYPWHDSDEAKARDLEKSKAFKSLGYNLIRVRDRRLNPQKLTSEDIIASLEHKDEYEIDAVKKLLEKLEVNGTENYSSFNLNELYEELVATLPVLPSRSLAIKFPEIAKQWHPTKNGKMTPLQVNAHENQKRWWVCGEGHEWEAKVSNRTSPLFRGCPVCTNQMLVKGLNDLETKNPEIAKEWHPTKNLPLLPSDVFRGTMRKVWWMCDQGHEWQGAVSNRASASRKNKRGQLSSGGCPICVGQAVIVGENDLKTLKPAIAAQWHPTKNSDRESGRGEPLRPDNVTVRSGHKVWWMCDQGHEWEEIIAARTEKNRFTGMTIEELPSFLNRSADLSKVNSKRPTASVCPKCWSEKIIEEFNEFSNLVTRIRQELVPFSNGRTPIFKDGKMMTMRTWEETATIINEKGYKTCLGVSWAKVNLCAFVKKHGTL